MPWRFGHPLIPSPSTQLLQTVTSPTRDPSVQIILIIDRKNWTGGWQMLGFFPNKADFLLFQQPLTRCFAFVVQFLLLWMQSLGNSFISDFRECRILGCIRSRVLSLRNPCVMFMIAIQMGRKISRENLDRRKQFSFLLAKVSTKILQNRRTKFQT